MTPEAREAYLEKIDTACLALEATAVGGRLAFGATVMEMRSTLFCNGHPDRDVEEGRYRLRAVVVRQADALLELLEFIGE